MSNPIDNQQYNHRFFPYLKWLHGGIGRHLKCYGHCACAGSSPVEATIYIIKLDKL